LTKDGARRRTDSFERAEEDAPHPATSKRSLFTIVDVPPAPLREFYEDAEYRDRRGRLTKSSPAFEGRPYRYRIDQCNHVWFPLAKGLRRRLQQAHARAQQASLSRRGKRSRRRKKKKKKRSMMGEGRPAKSGAAKSGAAKSGAPTEGPWGEGWAACRQGVLQHARTTRFYSGGSATEVAAAASDARRSRAESLLARDLAETRSTQSDDHAEPPVGRCRAKRRLAADAANAADAADAANADRSNDGFPQEPKVRARTWSTRGDPERTLLRLLIAKRAARGIRRRAKTFVALAREDRREAARARRGSLREPRRATAAALGQPCRPWPST
jgi:hypothetical protein